MLEVEIRRALRRQIGAVLYRSTSAGENVQFERTTKAKTSELPLLNISELPASYDATTGKTTISFLIGGTLAAEQEPPELRDECGLCLNHLAEIADDFDDEIATALATDLRVVETCFDLCPRTHINPSFREFTTDGSREMCLIRRVVSIEFGEDLTTCKPRRKR